jgi:hypothetical protein
VLPARPPPRRPAVQDLVGKPGARREGRDKDVDSEDRKKREERNNEWDYGRGEMKKNKRQGHYCWAGGL